MKTPKFVSTDRERFNDEVEGLINRQTPYALSILSAIHRFLHQFHLENRHDVTEIVSEAYSRGIVKIDRGEVIYHPLAWIRSTAFYIIREKSRELRRLSATSYSELTERDGMTGDRSKLQGLERLVECEENEADCQAILKAYQQLPSQEQQLIDLKILQQLPWRDIRERWLELEQAEVTLEALRKRKSRAVSHLRELYHQHRS
ncbi:MAG: sigma-70 family RNA polymerase sigma factor [Cyanobacteria bacterium SID2]|nr:sigma-70 family RNA polymerase sigma factor [Cyanobacteria bacterium SID2]MBP0003378.1 sigma-70 family RNA polymerase sigma factor [Cyanobacteria bacterium SBC]